MDCTSHHKACECREALFFALYEATNALMAKLGYHGEINALDGADVMTALAGLDGGVYNAGLVFKEIERGNMAGSRYRAAIPGEIKCSACFHGKEGDYRIRCGRWTVGAPMVGKNMTCDSAIPKKGGEDVRK
jgi:hypothetical protein